MKVMISGSSGLIGTALTEDFKKDGHDVIALPRKCVDPVDFSEISVVVHLAGESIAEGRWSADKKKRIEASRVEGTRAISQRIAESRIKPSVFICASAIGFYGDRSDKLLDENSSSGDGFLPEVCRKWEKETEAASEAGVRTVHIRTGIVLSSKGGALKKMLPPFRLGGGGMLGNGKQYMSWISLDDEISAIRFLIDHSELEGPFNLVAPNPVTNHDFTKILGNVLRRPTVLPLPAFAARLMFGEMADALLLSSTRVVPNKLIDAGYQFKYPTLKEALEKII